MKDDRLLDDDLKAAFRSVRDEYDGTNAESNSTLQRALFRTRTRERRTRVTRWVVLPIAAVLAASTAWAGMTGKLPAVGSLLESFHTERTPPTPPLPLSPQPASSLAAAEPIAETPPVEVASVAAPVEPAPETAPVQEPARPTVAPSPIATARPSPSIGVAPAAVDAPAHSSEPAPVAAPTASAPDPHAALFAEAHRLHFIDRDPARALAAWDRYLVAAPNGRFAPEARYNRALALVRLGRHAEAQAELAAFASGTYGSYRREEAKALLDALTRDASRP